MRESSLVARHDERGEQVLIVQRPIAFGLEATARAMHAIVDPHLSRLGARQHVGRTRVRQVLRHIVVHGWPDDYSEDAARVAYWRSWLITSGIFTATNDEQGT